MALKLFRRPSGVRPRRPASTEDDLDPTVTSAPSRAGSARGREAMVREGRLLARVRHPNIAVIYGADEIDGRVGIWMDYIRGRTLHDLVREQGRFGPQEAVLIGLDLCRALAAVHACGLIHRDVKAQNVMREEGGRTVLMDFGVGIELPTGAARVSDLPSGTPQYMAPEVLLQGVSEPASDQYSLGVLLFFLMTGEFPIVGVSLDELTEKLRRGERRSLRDVRPDLPMQFIEVVERALEGDPAARYAGMGEMERALTAVIGSGGARIREAAAGPGHGAGTRTEGACTDPVVSGATLTPGTPAAIGPARELSVRVAVMLVALLLAVGTIAGVALCQKHHPRPRGVPIPRQITFDGRSSSGEISPDGKSVFYVTVDEDSVTCWLQDLGGGGSKALCRLPKQAVSGRSRWDPDGSRVLSELVGQTDTSKAGIYEIKRDGGTPSRLFGFEGFFAFSPDSRQIIGAWVPWEGRHALTDLRSGSRVERQVKERVGWLLGVDWGGPQGQVLIAEKDKTTLATRGSQDLTWGRNGKILYQRPSNRNFHFLDPISEEERPLVEIDSVGWMSYPLISPDGRKVLVLWNREPGGQSLWLIDTERGEERGLHTSSGTLPVGWSPDGQWIWAWVWVGSAGQKVVRIPVAGGPPEPTCDLPFSDEESVTSLAMAPDGSFFVASVREDQSDIWLVDNFDPDVR